jgi:soluble lytic murein transglycosylase-like protein
LFLGYVLQLNSLSKLEAELWEVERSIKLHTLDTGFLGYQDNTIVAHSVLSYKPQILGYYVSRPYYSEFLKYNWDARLMYAIMLAESGGNTEAVNKGDRHSNCSGSYGLMQLGCLHFGKYGLAHDNWHIPEVNIRVAYEIYQRQGLRAWGAYSSGAYLRH